MEVITMTSLDVLKIQCCYICIGEFLLESKQDSVWGVQI